MNEAELMPIAAGATEAVKPAGLFQSGLTVRLSAVELLKIWQREGLLELDAAARHDPTGIYVSLYAA